MVEADLAVGAAGTTSWERCCVGLPTILLVLADNQRFAAHNLSQVGAVKLLEVTDALESVLIPRLCELCQSEAMRLSLAHTAARVTDGLGTRRVIDEIAPRARNTGSSARSTRS